MITVLAKSKTKKSHLAKNIPILKLGSWNVHTLISGKRSKAIVVQNKLQLQMNNKFLRIKVDIVLFKKHV